MSRHAKPARLWLRERDGREDTWLILHQGRQFPTGCAESDHQGAERALAEYVARYQATHWSETHPSRVPVTNVLTLHAGSDHVEGLRRSDTVDAAVLKLGEFFAEDVLASLTPGRCKAYRKWRGSQPKARWTKDPANAPRVGDPMVRRELEVLQAAIHAAHADHKLDFPVKIWMPDAAQSRTRFLSRSEVARLIKAAWRAPQGKSRHLARWLIIAFYTGTRADAALALQWMPNTTGGWVDLEQGLIFRKAVAQTETDKRRPPVAISKRLAAHLRRWRPESGKGYVVDYKGGRVTTLRRSFVTACKAAGLGPDVIPHTLRHTFASHAIMNGISPGEVAEAIGTTEGIIKRVYGHLSTTYTRPAVEAVARGRR
jgi:integrase